MKTVTLTFSGKTETITANANSMFNLNNIHRAFGLPKDKEPSQWRNALARYFRDSANLQSERQGRTQQLMADEDALYAYAMWCDVRFYAAVVRAFRHVSNGELRDAVAVAASVNCVHTERAKELYRSGGRGGYPMRRALESLDGDVQAAVALMNDIARALPSHAAKERDAYWQSVVVLLKQMQDDYRTFAKQFDVATYQRFETLLLHATKRQKSIVKHRLSRVTKTICRYADMPEKSTLATFTRKP